MLQLLCEYVELVKYLCSIIVLPLIVFILEGRNYYFHSVCLPVIFIEAVSFQWLNFHFPSLVSCIPFSFHTVSMYPTTSANEVKRIGVSGDSGLLEHYYRFNRNSLK